MLKLVIGNRAYSSWSMRGWLAAKQSGLPFEEELRQMWTPEWDVRRDTDPLFAAPTKGQVPILWDGDVAVWDSLAIIDWLADRVGRDIFWPADPAARAFARSISAEMHSGYQALRNDCGMNVRRTFPGFTVSEAARADADRVDYLWATARARFGQNGSYLFGDFGAADIMFAPVVTRFRTYGVAISPAAQAYADAILAHPWMVEWLAAADAEPWIIDRYEIDAG